MLRSALKKSPASFTDSSAVWDAPSDWDRLSSPSSTGLSAGSSSSEVSLASSFNTVTTSSSGRSARTVGFGDSVVSVQSKRSGGRLRLGGSFWEGKDEGRVVFQIFRFHSRKVLKSTHALWVDENDDCQYYVDYPEGGSSWGCRVFRGQDPFGPLVFTASRRKGKFEIIRHDDRGQRIVTLVGSSGMVTNKYTFSGYAGSTYAWKQVKDGYELNSYSGDKGKTKRRLGDYTVREDTNSLEPDSTGSVDLFGGERDAELALMVAFCLDDYEIASGSAHL